MKSFQKLFITWQKLWQAFVCGAEKPFTLMFGYAVSITLQIFALETYAGDGYDGVRLEGGVVVTQTGIEAITKLPTDELYGCGKSY